MRGLLVLLAAAVSYGQLGMSFNSMFSTHNPPPTPPQPPPSDTNNVNSKAISSEEPYISPTDFYDAMSYLTELPDDYDYYIVVFEDDGDSSMCDDTYPKCFNGNIHLCETGKRVNETKILHNCRMQGCSACPNGPDICNDEASNNRCTAATSDRHVQSCSQNQAGKAYCAGNDVRYCNQSNLAVVVEYCDNRGCQNKPLACNALLRQAAPNVKAKGGKNGKAAKASTSSNSSNSTNSSKCDPTKLVRVQWSSMPDSDRQTYINAVVQLYKNGDMQKFAQLHYDNRDKIHGTGLVHFLIWHRVFLTDFEQRLRALPGSQCVTVPYWTYDYSGTPTDRRSAVGTEKTRLGQASKAGCIGGPFEGITHTLQGAAQCISRQPVQAQFAQLSNSIFTDLVQMNQPTLQGFSNSLQDIHGYPHVAMGSTFATHYSPIDPLFFVHHSNVDRLWTMWQACHNDYSWSEPQGLKQPIIAYPGVTVADFIHNDKYTWKGKTFSVKYGGGQLNDPSTLSSDFRRRVATACQNGQLSGFDNSPQPIVGIDSSWATGGPSSPSSTSVPLTCSSSTGITDFSKLSGVTAVYDNLSIQSCMASCSSFYWKNPGPSNCACTGNGGSSGSSSSIGKSVNSYTASCAGGTSSYGLYSAPAGSAGRRLLQFGGTMMSAGGGPVSGKPATSSSAGGSPVGAAPPDASGATTGGTTGSSKTTAIPAASDMEGGSMRQPSGSGSSKKSTATTETGGSSKQASSQSPTKQSNDSSETKDENDTLASSASGETKDENDTLASSASGEEASDSGSSSERASSEGSGDEIAPTPGSQSSATTAAGSGGSAASAPTPSKVANSPTAAPSPNATLLNSTGANATSLPTNVTNAHATIANATSANATHANATSANATSANATNTNATNANTTNTNSTGSNSTSANATKVCFAPNPTTATSSPALACSSAATTPQPLPSAWLTMNNLHSEAANSCTNFKPANATKSFDCIWQR